MTNIEIRCRCGGRVEHVEVDEIPPPPFPLLGCPPPEEWRGWVWLCVACGEQTGVTYDYGTLDLGIVRDSVLRDRPLDGFDLL